MTIKAVLFDLDGTLLDYDLRTHFLPSYLAALGEFFANDIPPEKLINGIMLGSDAIGKNDGSLTNEEAFARVFYPYVARQRDTLEPKFMKFYLEVFPTLRKYTAQKPEARHVVESIVSRGYAVVIATNPLFPAIAIQQRLTWAGVDDFPYRKVTSYENSHYAKPNLGYYREIVDELGCAPEDCLVVGDEAMDMVAGLIGCQTFLVKSPATKENEMIPQPTYQGNLYDVKALLSS